MTHRMLRDIVGERPPLCSECGRHHNPALAPTWAGLDDAINIIAHGGIPIACRRAAVDRIAFELRRRRAAILALRAEVRRLRVERDALRAALAAARATARADISPIRRRQGSKA